MMQAAKLSLPLIVRSCASNVPEKWHLMKNLSSGVFITEFKLSLVINVRGHGVRGMNKSCGGIDNL